MYVITLVAKTHFCMDDFVHDGIQLLKALSHARLLASFSLKLNRKKETEVCGKVAHP